MRSWKVICIGAVLMSIALAGAGCQNNPKGGSATPQAMAQTTPTPVTSTTETRVKDGAAPLSFSFVAGGNVRVMDATTGKQLVKTSVPPNTAVRVNAHSGVTANDKTLLEGPLPADHRYEIWLDRR